MRAVKNDQEESYCRIDAKSAVVGKAKQYEDCLTSPNDQYCCIADLILPNSKD